MINLKFWQGKRVLITGHSGFKGAWLTLLLKRLEAEVFGFSLLPEQPSLYKLARAGEDITGTYSDLRDYTAVKDFVKVSRPEIVIHLAAQALVRRAIEDPIEAISTNVMGTAHLLQALRDCADVSVILVVTSDKVYANTENGQAFNENDIIGGKDPYSASKAATELIAKAYRETYFVNTAVKLVTARGGNVIGGGDYSRDRIVPDILRAIEANCSPVLRMPEATRPWQHALDCLSGYLIYAQSLHKFENLPAALNFGPSPSNPITVRELTQELLRALGATQHYIYEPSPKSIEMTSLAVDSSLARNLLGWSDKLAGHTAINWTAEWYRRIADGEDAHSLTLTQIDKYLSL